MSERTDTHVMWWDGPSGAVLFSGRLNMEDVGRLRLDPLDRALLSDRVETAADFLLKIEMIFRRLAEQSPKEGGVYDPDHGAPPRPAGFEDARIVRRSGTWLHPYTLSDG